MKGRFFVVCLWETCYTFYRNLSELYSKKAKKWTTRKKVLPTVYNVYGKKTRNGTFKLIASTTSKKIKTSYRYVKIKTSKIWGTGKDNPL
ncbi:MAG: hypothetical protein HFG34_06730 [Eubacterium sp.]|nr:hypothetical protein [Eubacterium sp.]